MLILNIENIPTSEIEKYLGVVDSQVVIGANIFSDIFASFRDVFGGVTKSYQKDLEKLRSYTTNLLVQKAKKLGANAIIGVKVDFEELSGQGKSMFMLSMEGTAIIAKDSLISDTDIRVNQFEDVWNMALALYKKNEHLVKREQGRFFNDDKDLKFFTENNFWDDSLIRRLVEELKTIELYQISDNYTDSLVKVFSNTNEDLIYDILIKEIDILRPSFLICLKKGLIDNSSFCSDEILKLLSNKNQRIRYKGLLFALPIVKHYSKKNITDFENVLNFIENEFDSTIETYKKKKLMGEEEVYECFKCGQERTLNFCNKCSQSTTYPINSFKYNNIEFQVNVTFIKDSLRNIITVLRESFK